MKKLFSITACCFLIGVAFAETKAMPPESNNEAQVENKVDVSKNIFTGTKSVTTTKKVTTQAKPGVKTKKYSKNVKKYDKNGVLIKNDTETQNEAEDNQ